MSRHLSTVFILAGLSLFSRGVVGQALPAVAANGGYQGWVQMTYADDPLRIVRWNTATGAFGSSFNTPKGVEIHFENPQTREEITYTKATGEIRIRAIQRKSYTEGISYLKAPLTLDDLLANIRFYVGKDSVTTTQVADNGLDRVDLNVTLPPNAQRVSGILADLCTRTSTVWVDAKTKRIQRASINHQMVTLIYGVPAVTSIFEMGAPADAIVVDDRSAPEVLAILQRVADRAATPFPDGVMVRYSVENGEGMLLVYERAGGRSMIRQYAVASGAAKVGEVEMPENWVDAGSEELFRRLAAVFPEAEEGAEGSSGWGGNYDKITGAVTHIMEENEVVGRHVGDPMPGMGKIQGEGLVYQLLNELSPMSQIYPEFATPWSRKVTKIEDPQRPDQIGLWIETSATKPVPTRSQSTEWIDPTHGDRAVMFEFTTYDAKTGEIKGRQTTEFSQYATLPEPDGRSYPTMWKVYAFPMDETGKRAAKEIRSVTLHFFPGRKLPDLPKGPMAPKELP